MATVIKTGEQDPRLFKRLETVSVSDHLGEARLVLEASRQQSRELLHDTYVEAETIRKEASDKGYEAGFKRGYEAGTKAGYEAAFQAAKEEFRNEQEQLVRTLHELVAGYEQQKRDLFIRANNDVLQFAMRVAEKVTRQVGAVNCGAAVENLKAALREVESKTDLVIRVNKKDHLAIERFVETLMEDAKDAENLTIIVDDTIAQGGCRVHTHDIEIDVTLDAQIEQIASLVAAHEEKAE